MTTTALTTAIIAAYVERNQIAPSEIESLIRTVHGTLSTLGQEPQLATETIQKATPAQIRRSIRPDALISFEDGNAYRLLKRHLNTVGLTPQEYRAKWGLPADYPMTAPDYSAKRSEFAKAAGLGVKTRRKR